MKLYFFNAYILLFVCYLGFSQNKTQVKASFNIEKKQVKITQTIQYYNTTNDDLKTIYLNDWNNSFANKKTPLAIRFNNEFKNSFFLAKKKERGFSEIISIKQENQELEYARLDNQIDILKVELHTSLKPNSYYTLQLEYIVKLPNAKFTEYGITNNGDLNLRYWYITPAIYNGTWQYFSNKDLDDLYIPKSNIYLEITYPEDYKLVSDLDVLEEEQFSNKKTTRLEGKDRVINKLFLSKTSNFETIQLKDLSIISDIKDKKIDIVDKVLIHEKIKDFIFNKFGAYPHNKLLLTQIDSKKDPAYGLNVLPKFIKTYPKHFNYELKLLKVALHNYLESTLLTNPRKEQWLADGILIYYLMQYVEENYPKMKFLGSISKIWGVRSFHAANMDFNDKYTLAYMLMARTNRDQPLTMAKDSLLKFNKNIGNKYKAGIGLKYLDDYLEDNIVKNSLEAFIKQQKLKTTQSKDFESFIKSNTEKNIDWFFDHFLKTRKKIDFKIKKVEKTEDSITLTIKNKGKSNLPISLYSLNNDSIQSKIWVENILSEKTITIPRLNTNKLALNYNNVIPEFNLRDNWKSLKGFPFNNKPLQFRVFQDIEDPYYNQVFFMPLAEFNNIYDGFILGIKAYNKTVLRKLFNYKIQPKYAFGSESLTGSASISKSHYFQRARLHNISYGFSGSYTSFADGLFVRKFTPGLNFQFRDNKDLRSNEGQALSLRQVIIRKDEDLNNILINSENLEPNYSIFNMRYSDSEINLIRHKSWLADFQVGEKFSKLSFVYQFRRLFESNRQFIIRMYTGAFITNNNDPDSDFFSFSLDRPTDYLFDYGYLGRSESSGLFSQQYIDAEGGFKSKLEGSFANQWLSTVNINTSIWQYILAYGDVGFMKNKFSNAKFVYDSGIRINLVTDYFEVYFPVYSNLGWEIGQANYDQKIRFKFTASPKSLLGLFRRRWF